MGHMGVGSLFGLKSDLLVKCLQALSLNPKPLLATGSVARFVKFLFHQAKPDFPVVL
jgi:hypothetical protein